jgi:hypothetical protein
MKERPILFGAPMVRAILDGSKSQTRRVVRPCKDIDFGCELAAREIAGEVNAGKFQNSRYGKLGDRLWVKETTVKIEDHGWIGPIYAESDEGRQALEWGYGEPDDPDHIPPHAIKLRPSLFMPRSRSRILLEITDVRVERLQDISRGDAMAEGCPFPNMADGPDPREWFADIWRQINGSDSWAANPWVWVISFRRVEP